MPKVLLWLGFICALLLLVLGLWWFPLLIFLLCSAISIYYLLYRQDDRLGYFLATFFSLILLAAAGARLALAAPEKNLLVALLDGVLLMGLGLAINYAVYGFTSLIYVEAGYFADDGKHPAALRHGWLGQHLLSAFTPIIGMGRAFMVATGLYPLSVHVIKEGKSRFPPGDTLGLLGPSFVVVNKGDVVVTERFGRLRRVADRFFISEPFEYTMAAINVRPQTDPVEVEDLLTRDGVEVDIELMVRYQIRRGAVDGRRDEFTWEDRLAYDPDAVLDAAFKVKDWQQAVRDQAKLLTQEVVARYTLDDISDPAMRRTTSGASSPREEVVDEIRRRLDNDVARWGVELLDLAIEKVEVQNEALRPVRDYRQVSWERAIGELRAETERLVGVIEAKGVQEATEFRAEAQSRFEQIMNAAMAENLGQFLQAVTDGGGEIDAELLQRYIAVLEKVSWLIHKGDAEAIYTIETMEKIAESAEGRTTLFMPSGVTLPPGIPGRRGGDQS